MRAIAITETGEGTVSLLEIAVSVATTAREALVPLWIEWKRVNGYPGPLEPASRDVCVPTAFALRAALLHAVPEIRWTVAGGRPTKRTPAGGLVDASGRPHPHLWVAGRCREGIAVIDITADQFGSDPVVVSVSDGWRYTANATPGLLQRYARNEAVTVEMFLKAIDMAFHRQMAA